jgi:ribonucleoside-diphosphate reductase alpha chain
LTEIGLWNKTIKDKIIAGNGSIQHITEIPETVRAIYRTVWEIDNQSIIDMAAERGPFICQSQSLNCYMAVPDIRKLSALMFHAWKRGIKTGLYYLRTWPAAMAQKVTIDPKVEQAVKVSIKQRSQDVVLPPLSQTLESIVISEPASVSASVYTPPEVECTSCVV